MVRIGSTNLPDFPLLLAPMEDVSDPPFRAVCKDNGADLMYTEFISSEGLIRDAIKSRKKLDIFDYERPIGIQIFGGDKARTQNDIGQYFCGSSYCGHFTPRWMRSKECMETEIKQLRHQLDTWKNTNKQPT